MLLSSNGEGFLGAAVEFTGGSFIILGCGDTAEHHAAHHAKLPPVAVVTSGHIMCADMQPPA